MVVQVIQVIVGGVIGGIVGGVFGHLLYKFFHQNKEEGN
jgi:hypothetical protein